MDTQATQTAIRRARKRLAHAVRMKAAATSERAQHRHDRRERSARRALQDSVRLFESMAFRDATD